MHCIVLELLFTSVKTFQQLPDDNVETIRIMCKRHRDYS